MLPVNEIAHDLDSVSIAVFNLDSSLCNLTVYWRFDSGIVQKHFNPELSSLT